MELRSNANLTLSIVIYKYFGQIHTTDVTNRAVSLPCAKGHRKLPHFQHMGARGVSGYQIHKLDYKTKWYVYTRITPCEWVGGSAGWRKRVLCVSRGKQICCC